MRAGIAITITPEDLHRLEGIVRDRNSPQKKVVRAQVLIVTAEGCRTNEVMRRSGLSKTAVWRWQERFMRESVDRLLGELQQDPARRSARLSYPSPGASRSKRGRSDSHGRPLSRLSQNRAAVAIREDNSMAKQSMGSITAATALLFTVFVAMSLYLSADACAEVGFASSGGFIASRADPFVCADTVRITVEGQYPGDFSDTSKRNKLEHLLKLAERTLKASTTYTYCPQLENFLIEGKVSGEGEVIYRGAFSEATGLVDLNGPAAAAPTNTTADPSPASPGSP